jgi:UDPglucose 6-dehydrogenase/GDP-mannose 6-dehydrogenase
VIGTGYVGLTTGACLASLGHEVTCVDLSQARVDAINRAEAPFYEPGLPELLREGLGTGRLRAMSEAARAVAWAEVVFITVGTPDGGLGIDLRFVETAARDIGFALREAPGYQVVAVKSTVIPGTTSRIVRRALEEASGRRAGEFGLCMNPEFLREGAAVSDFMNPDRIVIGQWDQRAGDTLAKLYAAFDCPELRTTLDNAELVKYASNALLATLVSFSNEIAALCESTPGTDVEVVLRGVHLDRRLAPVVDGRRVRPGIVDFLRAGAGFGGSCLPKDVNALRSFARDRGVTPHILDAVVSVNTTRPGRLCAIAEHALGSLQGATVALLGLAFKPGTDDLRDSPALAAARCLADAGAIVRAFDPLVRVLPAAAGLDGVVTVCSTPAEALRDADAALLATAWPEFVQWDWTSLCSLMRRRIIVDGRNALAEVAWPGGTRYLRIGSSVDEGAAPP